MRIAQSAARFAKGSVFECHDREDVEGFIAAGVRLQSAIRGQISHQAWSEALSSPAFRADYAVAQGGLREGATTIPVDLDDL